MFKRVAGAVLAVGVVAAASAMAAPITGTINLSGAFQPLNGTPTQDLSLATGVAFLPGNGAGAGAFTTVNGSGTLSPFVYASGGTIKDFSFAPFAPVSSLYTITVAGQTLSFDLATVTVVGQNASFLALSGSGTLFETGYDATKGTFNFSGQSTSAAEPDATFSWSAGDQAKNAVPEPVSLAIFGVALAGFGLVRARRGASARVSGGRA